MSGLRPLEQPIPLPTDDDLIDDDLLVERIAARISRGRAATKDDRITASMITGFLRGLLIHAGVTQNPALTEMVEEARADLGRELNEDPA